MHRSFVRIVVAGVLLAFAASACEGGDDGGGDGGGVLVGGDCPDECIPACHFNARSQFADCFPHGTTISEIQSDITQTQCYFNGVKLKYEHTGNFTIFTYYKDGSVCFVQDKYHGGVDTELERETLKGKNEQLLEVVDFADPRSTDVFAVTCLGKVRQVSLVVNATNPACSKCPADPFALPENPDPPAFPVAGSCSVP